MMDEVRRYLLKAEHALEVAEDVFLDPLAVTIYDEDHSIDEERNKTVRR